jgi:hypothetical protein
MASTHSPRKTTAPAKKTTAKKTTTRAPRKPAAKQTAARLSLVKPDTDTRATVVDLRHPLPARRRPAGPYTLAQLTEARAALASAMAQLPVPHILWLTQIDGRAAARLTDGTHLIHTHHRDPEFTAYLRCPTGGIHTELVTNERDLKAARAITRTCTRRHDNTDPAAGTYDWHKAATLGVQTIVPTRLSPLNAGLQAVKKTTADTQPMSTSEIAAHIAEQFAADTPKEHPEP